MTFYSTLRVALGGAPPKRESEPVASGRHRAITAVHYECRRCDVMGTALIGDLVVCWACEKGDRLKCH